MRNSYHFCHSSHDEVMFRSEEDISRCFNCVALASFSTESRLLADAEMASHLHVVFQTDYPYEFMHKVRYPYTRYFNNKYHRNGRIGENAPFITPLPGLRRLLSGVSYVLRQGLHHGISTTPFGYPHCSVNTIFREDLGKADTVAASVSHLRGLTLPAHTKLPDHFRYANNGMLLRESVIDTAYVEELYVTPRNFLFQMNRFSNEEWMKEQVDELPDVPPILLDTLEPDYPEFDLKSLLVNEKGRVDRAKLGDLELCGLVDHEMVPRYSGNRDTTIYDLSESVRRSFANEIWDKYHIGGRVSVQQIKRCLIV